MTPAGRTALRVLRLAAGIVFLFPAAARAEWQFTPFLGYTFNGSTNLLDFALLNNRTANDEPRVSLGGSVRLTGDGPFGVEGYAVYTPGFFDAKQFDINLPRVSDSRTYAVMGNAVLTTPRAWNNYGLRPAISGGIGLIHAAATDERDVLPFSINLWGMNVGGGAVGFLSDRVGLRFDVRYFRSIKSVPVEDLEVPVTLGQPVRLSYWTAAFGIVFKK